MRPAMTAKPPTETPIAPPVAEAAVELADALDELPDEAAAVDDTEVAIVVVAFPPLPGASVTEEDAAPPVEVLPAPVTVAEADSRDDAADAVSSAVVSVGVAVTVAAPEEAVVVDIALLWPVTEDVAEAEDAAAEEELAPPVMWKGKEYWKVAGSESSAILKP